MNRNVGLGIRNFAILWWHWLLVCLSSLGPNQLCRNTTDISPHISCNVCIFLPSLVSLVHYNPLPYPKTFPMWWKIHLQKKHHLPRQKQAVCGCIPNRQTESVGDRMCCNALRSFPLPSDYANVKGKKKRQLKSGCWGSLMPGQHM